MRADRGKQYCRRPAPDPGHPRDARRPRTGGSRERRRARHVRRNASELRSRGIRSWFGIGRAVREAPSEQQGIRKVSSERRTRTVSDRNTRNTGPVAGIHHHMKGTSWTSSSNWSPFPSPDIDRAKDFYVRSDSMPTTITPVSEDLPIRPADPSRFGLLDLHRQGNHRRRARLGRRHAGSGQRHRRGRARVQEPRHRHQPDRRPGLGAVHLLADPDGNKWAVQEIVIPDLSGSSS